MRKVVTKLEKRIVPEDWDYALDVTWGDRPDRAKRLAVVARLVCEGLNSYEVMDRLLEIKISVSQATVMNDMRTLADRWLKMSMAYTAQHRANLLAANLHVERRAYEKEDLGNVLRAQSQRAQLLGLNKADRQEFVGMEGSIQGQVIIREEIGVEDAEAEEIGKLLGKGSSVVSVGPNSTDSVSVVPVIPVGTDSADSVVSIGTDSDS
jgi:hypothetical protein